jgi:ABC-type multidrug transport system fused ATPase/permease subunit
MYKSISESMMDAERLLELFQTKPSIVDRKDAQPLKLGKGEIKFESVVYHYDDNKETLKKLDFTIRGGSSVAIVGETGGGKSTILKLINRLYDVTSGRILIDGQDIREVTLTR